MIIRPNVEGFMITEFGSSIFQTLMARMPIPRIWLGVLMLASSTINASGEPGTLADQSEGNTSLAKKVDLNLFPWLTDFEYERKIYTAQKKQVVAYTMEMKVRHVESIRQRKLSWVSATPSADPNWVIGKSKGRQDEPSIPPQPIFGFKVTDPDTDPSAKQKVVLVGSNHPREDPACWTLHGLIEFIVSEDPRAKRLRKEFEFLIYPVVNPDGKWHIHGPDYRKVMTINGNPELKEAGETNHNRVWSTENQFSTIDITKAALLKDTGGKPAYFIDFHGIPWNTFTFSCQQSEDSPFLDALRSRGMNFRRSKNQPNPQMLRGWALQEPLSAQNALTPEIGTGSEIELLEIGLMFAESLHDVITGQALKLPDFSPSQPAYSKPPKPTYSWLLAGDADPLTGSAKGQFVGDIKTISEGPFGAEVGPAIKLETPSCHVKFPALLENTEVAAFSVALWLKGKSEFSDTRYVASIYQAKGAQRSWALSQMSDSSDILLTLSPDGSHNSRTIKRFLTTRWPHQKVISEHVWRHIAFTFSSKTKLSPTLYVDGRAVIVSKDGHYFNNNPINSLFQSNAPLTIGALSGSDKGFQGQVAELAIWHEELTQRQVAWLRHHSLRLIGALD